MKTLAIFAFIVFLNINISNCNSDTDEVDYYEELINEGIRNSSSYEPKQDASEYRPANSVPIGKTYFLLLLAQTLSNNYIHISKNLI